jgi:hypothetical protein
VLGGLADLSGFAWSLGVDAILLTATAFGMVFIVRETTGRRVGQANRKERI